MEIPHSTRVVPDVHNSVRDGYSTIISISIMKATLMPRIQNLELPREGSVATILMGASLFANPAGVARKES